MYTNKVFTGYIRVTDALRKGHICKPGKTRQKSHVTRVMLIFYININIIYIIKNCVTRVTCTEIMGFACKTCGIDVTRP